MDKRRVYLDHAATTKIRPEVVEVMASAMRADFGNPSSVHREGQRAKKLLEEARERIASLLCCDTQEIYFTSGGTESDNWALKCASWRNSDDAGRSYRNEIITSSVEHPAVLRCCESLEKHGLMVTYLGVDETGLVSPESLEEALSEKTSLVSVMYANNEIGTIEPVSELCGMAHERGALFHTDAVQAVGMIPVDISALGVDLLSFSAHKFRGPKGVGGLYVRKGLNIPSFMEGGAQESSRRAGTENLPAILGMAEALELAVSELNEVSSHVRGLKDLLVGKLREAFPNVRIHAGDKPDHPGIVNFYIPSMDGEKTLLLLDYKGFAVSGGAACASKEHTISHVLSAIGCGKEEAGNSLRISLGASNTEEEILDLISALRSIVLT